MILPVPRPTLFPYTTLFRSNQTCFVGRRNRARQRRDPACFRPAASREAVVSLRRSVRSQLVLIGIVNTNRLPRTSPFSTQILDRKSTRLNSSHLGISYAVFC